MPQTKMTNKQMKNIFILTIGIIAVLGFLDSIQIIPWQTTQDWIPYNQHVMPAILTMWFVALAGIAVMYYILKKDKSEAIGIFVAGGLMLAGGLEDIFFFILSSNSMPAFMCWFTGPQTIVSSLMNQCCVTPTSLVINALLFTIVAWFALKWFFKQKW